MDSGGREKKLPIHRAQRASPCDIYESGNYITIAPRFHVQFCFDLEGLLDRPLKVILDNRQSVFFRAGLQGLGTNIA